MRSIASEYMVYLTTNEGRACPFHGCKVFLDSERFEDSCNHLLKARGLRCLHVGQETGRTSNGDFLHCTVAVFGK